MAVPGRDTRRPLRSVRRVRAASPLRLLRVLPDVAHRLPACRRAQRGTARTHRRTPAAQCRQPCRGGLGLLAPQSLRCPVSGAIRRVTQTHPQPSNGSTPGSRKLSSEVGEVLIPLRGDPPGSPGLEPEPRHARVRPSAGHRPREGLAIGSAAGSAGLLRLFSRRSPPRPPARRAPPSRRLAARWPSSSMSRPAELGRSSPWRGRTCRA